MQEKAFRQLCDDVYKHGGNANLVDKERFYREYGGGYNSNTDKTILWHELDLQRYRL